MSTRHTRTSDMPPEDTPAPEDLAFSPAGRILSSSWEVVSYVDEEEELEGNFARWDELLVAAASFPDEAVAEACADAIFQANVDEITAFVAGPRTRLRPLRMHFEMSLGLMETRDGSADPRTGVMLVHNDDGAPLVYNTYPDMDRQVRAEWPALEHFFGAYFHADWIDEEPSATDAVRTFVRESPAEDIAAVLVELRLLQQTGDESERRQLMFDQGSFFVPRPDGEVDEFLAEAIEVLESPLPPDEVDGPDHEWAAGPA